MVPPCAFHIIVLIFASNCRCFLSNFYERNKMFEPFDIKISTKKKKKKNV